MKTELRGTAIEGGRGNVATTFQVIPSQWTIRLRVVEPSGKLPVPK
jgi:transcriptional regulator CtsR